MIMMMMIRTMPKMVRITNNGAIMMMMMIKMIRITHSGAIIVKTPMMIMIKM